MWQRCAWVNTSTEEQKVFRRFRLALVLEKLKLIWICCSETHESPEGAFQCFEGAHREEINVFGLILALALALEKIKVDINKIKVDINMFPQQHELMDVLTRPHSPKLACQRQRRMAVWWSCCWRARDECQSLPRPPWALDLVASSPRCPTRGCR